MNNSAYMQAMAQSTMSHVHIQVVEPTVKLELTIPQCSVLYEDLRFSHDQVSSSIKKILINAIEKFNSSKYKPVKSNIVLEENDDSRDDIE